MLNLKSKKVLSALLSLSLAFEPMALAENNPKNTSEQSLGNKIVQKAKKVVTHPGFYIPAGIVGTVVGTGAICLTGKALYNNHKYSKPRQMESSNTNNEAIEVRDGYNCLGEEEKIIYKIIEENCENFTNEVRTENGYYKIEICVANNMDLTRRLAAFCRNNYWQTSNCIATQNISLEKQFKIINAFKSDHPEIFWIYSRPYTILDDDRAVICLYSLFSRQEVVQKKKELEDKVSKILSQIPDGATDYEKARFIHDYICENCKYFEYPKEESDAVKWKVQTAYGCLCEGKSVCEGIARAYQLLMNRAGVECRTIYGAANEDCLVIKLSKVLDSNLNHAWNIIKINGEWRHVDVTWDLPCAWYKKCVLRGGKYGYFLLTNEEIKEDHRIGIPYGNGNEEIKNANGYRNCNLPEEIAKDIKVYY